MKNLKTSESTMNNNKKARRPNSPNNTSNNSIPKDLQFYKFSAYGFLKNLRFFEPFLVLFFLEKGINFVEIGLLMGIREIAVNFLELPTGMVADGFGRRKAMIFSFLSYIASFVVFSFLSGFYFFAGAMLLFSFGEAFRTGTHKAMILSYLEIKKIKHLKVHYYGRTRGASQLGSALSSLIAAALVFYQGSFRWVFLASIVPYIIELFLMVSYPKELDGHIIPGKKSLKDVRKQFAATWRDFIHVFTHMGTLKGLLSSAVFSGLFKGIKDYLQPLLKQYAIALPFLLSFSEDQRTTVLVGFTYFMLFLLTAYVSGKSGTFADKMKNLPWGLNITFVAGTVFLFFSGIALFAESYKLSIGLFIFLYLLQNLRKPISVGYISETISSGIMATGLSGESQLQSIFSALFSFLMGAAVHYFGLSTGIVLISLVNLVLYPLVRIKVKQQ